MSKIAWNQPTGLAGNSGLESTTQIFSSSKEAMTKSLLDLVPGDTFHGQVLDIKQDSVTIQIGGQLIEGKLEQDVSLSINQTIKFVIKETEGNKVVIAPVLNHGLEGADAALYQALEQAGLAATDKNIDTVMELLNHQMPLDKGTIQKVLAFSYQYPEADLKDIVLMLKNQIPITKESMEQWQNYKNSNHQITASLKEIVRELPHVIDQVLIDNGKETVHDVLNNLFRDSAFDSIRLKLNSELDNIDRNESKETFKALLAEASDEFLKNLAVKPEEFKEETIAEHLKEVEKQVSLISDKLGVINNSEEAMKESAKEIKNNLNFMKELNQTFIYTQLPIQLSKQIAHSDLYVFTNRNVKKTTSDGVRLLLHLDMEFLGSTDILIAMQGINLNLEFTFTDQNSADITKIHIEELNQRLNKKGYQVTSYFNVNEDKNFDFVEDFICQNDGNGNVTRYSFDMRA